MSGCFLVGFLVHFFSLLVDLSGLVGCFFVFGWIFVFLFWSVDVFCLVVDVSVELVGEGLLVDSLLFWLVGFLVCWSIYRFSWGGCLLVG